MNFLSKEEQYKEILSQEEIGRIRDFGLRRIREDYWIKRHQAHMDEYNIPDHEIGAVWERIKREEMEAIKKYKREKGS